MTKKITREGLRRIIKSEIARLHESTIDLDTDSEIAVLIGSLWNRITQGIDDADPFGAYANFESEILDVCHNYAVATS